MTPRVPAHDSAKISFAPNGLPPRSWRGRICASNNHNGRTRHTDRVWSRAGPPETPPEECPSTRPATTTASTPEVWIASRDVAGERNPDGESVVDKRIVDPATEQANRHCRGEADREPTQRFQRKRPDSMGCRESTADHGSDRDLVRRQGRRVVEEPFPFNQGGQVRRQAGSPPDRKRRDGIGRSDCGTQRHRESERKADPSPDQLG
jgi:hypothetical protein